MKTAIAKQYEVPTTITIQTIFKVAGTNLEDVLAQLLIESDIEEITLQVKDGRKIKLDTTTSGLFIKTEDVEEIE